jgi:hypothetical protein
MITGDLLNGAGADLVNIDQATDDGTVPTPEHDPLDVAERACQASLSEGPGKVVGSGKDGLTGDWIPGYFVFIETGAGTYLCDATADAQVWGLRRDRRPAHLRSFGELSLASCRLIDVRSTQAGVRT